MCVLCVLCVVVFFLFFQAEDGIRDLVRSRGLGDVYKRQVKKDDMFVGFYSVKALSEKVLNNGQTLNKKSKYILNKIIT